MHAPCSFLETLPLQRVFFPEGMVIFCWCVHCDRCRAGALAAQEALPKLWPPNQAAGPGQAFNQIAICGETASPKVQYLHCCFA